MSDYRDVMATRAEADRHVRAAETTATRNDAAAVVSALLAIRAELRAFATLIDYARSDAT